MRNTVRVVGGGGGDVGLSLLAVLFIGLKLTGHIDWSWWWVLAPVWIPAALMLVIIFVAFVVSSRGR